MHSPGTWATVPFLARQESDDSSSGIDRFSLISANAELSETSYLDLDPILKMPPPLGNNQSPPENLPPVRHALVDWAQESLHDQSSNATTGLQRARGDGVPPHTDQAKQACATTDEQASRQEGRQRAKVYDITTLLKLRETQRTVPVMLRVKPEAISENIFQYMGASTSRRQPTRSRGLSDISNISTGNTESYSNTVNPVVRPKYITQPFRQPHAPPETSALQRHDGFARFLKQHASPPHHRVTAGGRIVPANPSSPPPMLDFGSLNGLLRDRAPTAKPTQKESRSNQPNARAQNSQGTSSMTLGDYLQSQSSSTDGMSFQHTAQPPPIQSLPFSNLPFGYQAFMPPVMQTQASLVPLAMFPDGSTLVSYNGMNYRASWNGANTTMEPLQHFQLPADQQYHPQAYPQAYLNNIQYGGPLQPQQTSVPPVPLASATNFARPDTTKVESNLQQEVQNGDELSLKAKLMYLDKHLALYHYDIMPADRASLVAQRRCLVEEIDKIRLSKDKPKHSIPIIAPVASGLPVTPAAQLTSSQNNIREGAQNDGKAKGTTLNKHLSPAAPAFVPRKASNLPSSSFSMRTANQSIKPQQFGMPAPSAGINSALQVKGRQDSSTWSRDIDYKPIFSHTGRTPHNAVSSSSNILDPSDPAMRVIEYEDIEYAARYLYNWTKDAKTYCTTVAEFQEAIRRVREQARLYGCAGGQSKDPAYDAEQDLWWAICDRDPIPLPSKTPDHVTNPRPWNWNDSAFNYRRQGANDAPGPECEQARNSPRVRGWDPTTTDKMKDHMDVSRSYYALKGRLPSVSFRDFAYDRDGNKKLIQSDTAVSAAYAAAAKDTTSFNHDPTKVSQQHDNVSNSGSSALEQASSSELNLQRTDLALDTQSKSVNSTKATEAASLPRADPHTPEHKRIQQPMEASNVRSATRVFKQSPSTGHGAVTSKSYNTVCNPHYAYVEDYPETPLVGGIRSASKEELNVPTKTTPSEVRLDSLSTNTFEARTGSPVGSSVLDGMIVRGSNWKPTEEELDSIWYHTPLDEVTQKYLDDMKTYNPFKDKQANENNTGVDTTKDHGQASDSSEPVAESKSPWGPEEGTTPTTSSNQNRSTSLEMHTRAQEHESVKAAKVKIPKANTLRAPIPYVNGNNRSLWGFNVHSALDSREVKAVNVPTVESNDSHNFLRKMLKSPQFWSAQPTNVLSQISSTLADRINGTKRIQANSPGQHSENKRDTLPNKHANTSTIDNGRCTYGRPQSSTSRATTKPNLAISKAQSSLASSTYQAHGYLPQFDGAGKAHTSSVYRDQGIQRLPQVRLPSEDSYSDAKHATQASSHQIHGASPRTPRAVYHNPVNFGYDGGRDSPPPKAKATPNDQQSSRPEFDTKGVTLADYENQRGDTDNAWHHGAVDDFFEDLRVQELKTIASHQRVNTKSAA